MIVAFGSRMTRKSTLEFVRDGMIVRFAFHNPRKIFFNLGLLLKFVQAYMDDVYNGSGVARESVFKGDGFRLVFWKQNVAKLELDRPISGHAEMRLPKDHLIDDVCALFVN